MFPSFSIDGYEFYSYPLIIGMMWAYSFMYLKQYFKLKDNIFPYWNLFYFVLFLFAWFGAKIFFIFTLDSAVLEKSTLNSNFWLGGGFVFYGGLLAGLAWIVFYKYLLKVQWKTMRIFIPVLALGHGVGRLGCFMAGCCYGNYCDLPWAIDLHGGLRHPTQLYEAFSLFILAYIFKKRVDNDKPVIFEYFLSYSILRYILELFRGDEIRGIVATISTSQLVSIILLGASVFGLLIRRRAKSRFEQNNQL
jgi:phosphatidylglycerol:prolipoprotein diacylglycerol transferase